MSTLSLKSLSHRWDRDTLDWLAFNFMPCTSSSKGAISDGLSTSVQAFLPLLGTDLTLKGKPGKILNMSSIYGSYTLPFCVSSSPFSVPHRRGMPVLR